MRIETLVSFVEMLRERPWSPLPWSNRRMWNRHDGSNAMVFGEDGYRIEYDPFGSAETRVRLPLFASREEYCDLAVLMEDAADRRTMVAQGAPGDLDAVDARIARIVDGWRESIKPCCVADVGYYIETGQADAYAELAMGMDSLRDVAEWLGRAIRLPEDDTYEDEELGAVRVIHSERALIEAVLKVLRDSLPRREEPDES